MENENIHVTLTVGQWNALLGALSTAPFQVYSNVTPIVNAIQVQAGPQMEEASKKYQTASDDAAINPS